MFGQSDYPRLHCTRGKHDSGCVGEGTRGASFRIPHQQRNILRRKWYTSLYVKCGYSLPCVSGVPSALCQWCAQRLVSVGVPSALCQWVCPAPCVSGCAQRLVSVVCPAPCVSGCAQRLVSVGVPRIVAVFQSSISIQHTHLQLGLRGGYFCLEMVCANTYPVCGHTPAACACTYPVCGHTPAACVCLPSVWAHPCCVCVPTQCVLCVCVCHNSPSSYPAPRVCLLDHTNTGNEVVPIAVGAALGVLVAIVLLAYLLGKLRNKRKSSYEALN